MIAGGCRACALSFLSQTDRIGDNTGVAQGELWAPGCCQQACTTAGESTQTA